MVKNQHTELVELVRPLLVTVSEADIAAESDPTDKATLRLQRDSQLALFNHYKSDPVSLLAYLAGNFAARIETLENA
jgi:hypothetical protein